MTIEPVNIPADGRKPLWACSNRSGTFAWVRAANERDVRRILMREVEKYHAGEQPGRPEILD